MVRLLLSAAAWVVAVTAQCSSQEDFNVAYNGVVAWSVSSSNFTAVSLGGFVTPAVGVFGGGIGRPGSMTNINGGLSVAESSMFQGAASFVGGIGSGAASTTRVNGNLVVSGALNVSGAFFSGDGSSLTNLANNSALARPGPPTNLTAVKSGGWALLNWTAPAYAPGGIVDYEIVCSPEPAGGTSYIQYVGSARTSYNFTGLLGGTTYTFAVRAMAPTTVSKAVTASTAATSWLSCYHKLLEEPTAGSGLYTIDPDGPLGAAPAVTTYCDMATDAGGWTQFYAGPNGGANNFAPFDTSAMTCTNAMTSCQMRVPSSVNVSFSIMAMCGSHALKFGLNPTVLNYFQAGVAANWVALPAGAVTVTSSVVNSITGQQLYFYGTNGWIISSNQTSAPNNVFASVFSGSGGWDYCNGAANVGTTVRLFYRQSIPAYRSCRELQVALPLSPSGVYVLDPDGTGPAQSSSTYCDMTTDGGGWTAFFVGSNGGANAFATFETSAYNCPNPSTQCLRRAPATVDTTYSILAQCGTQMVKFGLNTAAVNYFVNGQQGGWFTLPGGHVPVTSGVAQGVISNSNMYLFAGSGAAAPGWILTGRDDTNSRGFASIYPGNWDFCNGVANTGSPIRLYYRQYISGRYSSCRDLFVATSAASGLYTIDPDGSGPIQPHETYCDMATDAGGWTQFFVGTNGGANAFSSFEFSAHNCPNTGTQCLRRPPATIDATYSFMAQCGTQYIKFGSTPSLLTYFTTGTQQNWFTLPAGQVAVTGGVAPVIAWSPNLHFYAGSSGASSPGWILAGNSDSSPKGFASIWTGNSWDYCNAVSNGGASGSVIRLYYREYIVYPQSCRDVQLANPSATSGLYTIDPDLTGPMQAYQAYCDMSTDGGGWTQFFVGTNGGANAFSSFEWAAVNCPSVTTQCLRRPPAAMDTTYSVLASCGSQYIKFALTPALVTYFTTGSQQNWFSLPAGHNPSITNGVMQLIHNLPSISFYAGSGGTGSPGWIIAAQSDSVTKGFASIWPSLSWDYCNGVANGGASGSVIRLLYRPFVTRYASCQALLAAQPGTPSGLYDIDIDGSGSFQSRMTYCDMTTDGGGWTAFWVGLNGKANVFARYDTHYLHCPDPANQCLRRLPAQVTTNSWLMATCGSASIKFKPVQQILNYFQSGTLGQGWQGPHTATAVAGSPAMALNSMWIWTGDGSANYGWILANAQAQGINTFASSYDPNTSWDSCNGVGGVGTRQLLFYKI